MTLLNIKNTAYETNIKDYKFVDPYDDNFHRALKHMQHNKTHIKPVVEPEITQYNISKIKKIEPYHDNYDMHITLSDNFSHSKIKLSNPVNIEKAKSYDNIPSSITFENIIPDAYYQYQLKNKTSKDFMLSNLKAENDIPSDINYLVMNQETKIPLDTLKRENLDREAHLKILLTKHERKQSKYTDTTNILQKDLDNQIYNSGVKRAKQKYNLTRPSTYANKPIIKPVSIKTAPIAQVTPIAQVAPVASVAPVAAIQPIIIPTTTPATTIQTSPPKIMLTPPPSQIVQKSSKSKQAVAQTNLPSPRQKQKVNEIFVKSDILDSSTNLPDPSIKGRGRPAAKQHDNETPEQYNARLLRNEKAVTTRKTKTKAQNALKNFNTDQATKLLERYNKLFGDRPLIQEVQKY